MHRAAPLVLALALATGGCATAHRREVAASQVDLATAHLREGNPQGAIALLERAVRLDRRNWDAWNKLALAYMAQGRPDLAEKAYRRALRLAPERAEVNNNYGLMLLAEGRLDEAIEHFEVATRDLTYRSPAIALSNLGYALYRAGRLDEALRRLDEAVRRAPNLCQARFNRGLVRMATGEAEGALEDFDGVIALCGDEAAGAYYHGAQALLALGDAQGACTYLRTLLREHPMSDLAESCAELYNRECR